MSVVPTVEKSVSRSGASSSRWHHLGSEAMWMPMITAEEYGDTSGSKKSNTKGSLSAALDLEKKLNKDSLNSISFV